MAQYVVKGEADAEVTVPGIDTPVKVGSTVELEESVAAPSVESGLLEAAAQG